MYMCDKKVLCLKHKLCTKRSEFTQTEKIDVINRCGLGLAEPWVCGVREEGMGACEGTHGRL